MVRSSHQPSFTTAKTLELPQPLPLSAEGIKLVGGLVAHLEASCITMIEADELKHVHKPVHQIMVDAVANNRQVLLVDLANCFNPQRISSIAFSQGLHSQLILQQIGLARPFQIHHAVSIIEELVRQANQTDAHHLIVITDISSLFFTSNLANEDPKFPIPQLEKMRQCIGILESLVVQGHSVLITNDTTRIKSIPSIKEHQINPTALQISAKVHIKIDHTDSFRRVQLLSHPYLPTNENIERDLETIIKKRRPANQRSLEDFFD